MATTAPAASPESPVEQGGHNPLGDLTRGVRMSFEEVLTPMEARNFRETEVRSATITINHDDFPGTGERTKVLVEFPGHPDGPRYIDVLAGTYEVLNSPDGVRMSITEQASLDLTKKAGDLLGSDSTPEDGQVIDVQVEFLVNDVYSNGLITRIVDVQSHEG